MEELNNSPESGKDGMDGQKMITVVSGLPRSGTSMMMNMLKAGGMELLVDDIRKADEDNPRGYYELEKVKQMDKDISWLSAAPGKAIKVISMLLKQLPGDQAYKVIFMLRHMKEVMASQQKMLERLGSKPAGGASDAVLIQKFRAHLMWIQNWMKNNRQMDVIYIKYHEVLENPRAAAGDINTFLGGHLDPEKMIQVIDKDLYRQKLSTAR